MTDSLKGLTDVELHQRFVDGDEAVLGEFFERYHRRVYSLCFKILKNSHDAEDVTQEVFINLHRKLPLFKRKSLFTTWLHRFTVNQALMFLRSKKRFRLIDEQIDEIEHEMVQNGHIYFISPLDKILLESSVKDLAPGYKKVFILHDIQGFEHEEIGKLLGISSGTSKSQLHKARVSLRNIINKRNHLFWPTVKPAATLP